MVEAGCSQFDRLSANIGDRVLAECISSYGWHLTGGRLLEVNPFYSVIIDNNEFPFLGDQDSVRTILGEQGELLYHNPCLISHPQTVREFRRMRYCFELSGGDLEATAAGAERNLIGEIREFERLRDRVRVEGGRVIMPELRPFWRRLCNDRHLVRIVLRPALDVMEVLKNGYHLSLSEVDARYGLSGYQFNTMVLIIDQFATEKHPEVEEHMKWLNQMR